MCPTVLSLTIVRHMQTMNAADYARLIIDAAPTYAKAKAYVYVSSFRLRLRYENMPTHQDIRDFGEELSAEKGYQILDESFPSRVLLLSRLNRSRKFT